MPQLDPASFSSQLFWMTMSFVVLYVLLARFLLPRIQSVIALRSHTIEGDIEQAKRMKSDAERARHHYEKALADARAKSQAMLAESTATIAGRAAKQQAELDKTIEKKLHESDAAIRSSKQEVMDKLSPISAELASLIVEVLVHHKPNAKDIGAVIHELSKERTV
jgi:F-type H+-transporting ATPase subunit b